MPEIDIGDVMDNGDSELREELEELRKMVKDTRKFLRHMRNDKGRARVKISTVLRMLTMKGEEG